MNPILKNRFSGLKRLAALALCPSRSGLLATLAYGLHDFGNGELRSLIYDIEIQHIPGRKNPADALTRRHAQTDQQLNEAVKAEDSELVKLLQVPQEATDQDIQDALDQIFSSRHRPVPNSSSVFSGILSGTVTQDQDYQEDPVCAVLSSSTVQISSQFCDDMVAMLESESPYDSIIEELETAPLTQREVTRGDLKFRFKDHSLCVHVPGSGVSDQYWKIVVPDSLQVKRKLLKEIHCVPYSGHPGYSRTLELARRNWYWKGMASEVRDFVLECSVCQAEKGESQRPRGELQALKIPEQKWTDVSIDFITKLPVTAKGNDAVFVCVDRATKMCHLVACSEQIGAQDTATLYWNNIGKLHGIPKAIHSDRDVRFTSRFWKSLWKMTGTSLRFSTAYHPQSQGQVERMNAVVEQVVRCMIDESRDIQNWDQILSTVEFAMNSQVNRSTGFSPFFLMYGHHPTTPMHLLSDADTCVVESVDRFTRRLSRIFRQAKNKMHTASESYKQRYDRHHRPVEYQVGDPVLLSTANLRFKGTPAKLQRRFVGPFRITERIGTQAYRLELPADWKVHDVFHVALLKRWRHGEWTTTPTTAPPELEQEDDDEYEIERILRWRYYKAGNQKKKEYLVVWKGYPVDDASWIPVEHARPVEHFRNMIARDRPVEDTGGSS